MPKTKVAKKQVKESLTVREVLNVIDEALVKGDTDSGTLWNVLTALRGPDTGSYEKKQRHTVPIRRAAFPKVTKNADSGISDGPADFSRNSFVSPVDKYEHFGRHIMSAAYALGLTEEDDNVEI